MNLSRKISLPKLAPALLVAVLIVFSLPSGAETVHQEESDPQAAAYRVWISALESQVSRDSAWEFPFAAPRPGNLTDQEMKTLLSLRRLVRNREMEALATQTEIVARSQTELPIPLRFWLAYAQSTLHWNESCLENLQLLMQQPEGPTQLEPGQTAWVLTSLADHYFLLDERGRAALLYAELADSTAGQLNLWGQYQLAGMDFLKRNFEDANRRYQVVCESDKSGTWREHACSMAEIAGRLSSLNLKGEAHGDLAIVSP